MSNKLKITGSAGILFALGILQTLAIVKLVPEQIAASFFYAQAFIFFSVSAGNSTIMLKNFSQVATGKREFNLLYTRFQVIVTLSLAALSTGYLVWQVDMPIVEGIMVMVIALLNANTSITSFVRLFDADYLKTQFLRASVTAMRLLVLILFARGFTELHHLLLVFMVADSVAISGLLYLLHQRRHDFEFVRLNVIRHLSWGSLNSVLREIPRLFVFYLAERFFGSQAVIDLRLLLLPRENLASMMSILTVVFYKEIFERNNRLIFSVIFAVGLTFQLGFVAILVLFFTNLVISIELIAFYISTSAAFGVVQQQWALARFNREKHQVGINALSISSMLVAATPLMADITELSLVSYLTVFYVVWTLAIIYDNRAFIRRRSS